MGCDIHAYIDYDYRQNDDGKWIAMNWVSDAGIGGRNYTLFALMAGVRYDPRTDKDFTPLFQPRGLPESTSWDVKEAYCLHVSDEDWAQDADGYCTTEQAQKWTTPDGWAAPSVWMDEGHTVISHPDWHSVSWLTVEELEQVAKAYETIRFPEMSWLQMGSPEMQPIPENATATKMERDSWGTEWYVEVGEKKTYPAPTELKAVIAAMKELDGVQKGRSDLCSGSTTDKEDSMELVGLYLVGLAIFLLGYLFGARSRDQKSQDAVLLALLRAMAEDDEDDDER